MGNYRMEVVLKVKHIFKIDISNEELFRDRFNKILLKIYIKLLFLKLIILIKNNN